jgi:hypothetical protein
MQRCDRKRSDAEHAHRLIAVVVDDFDGDSAGFRRREGAADGVVERGPGVFVDVGSEGGF